MARQINLYMRDDFPLNATDVKYLLKQYNKIFNKFTLTPEMAEYVESHDKVNEKHPIQKHDELLKEYYEDEL
jgi:hypothetical protein